jgi:hypothetical protein
VGAQSCGAKEQLLVKIAVLFSAIKILICKSNGLKKDGGFKYEVQRGLTTRETLGTGF